MNGEHQCLKKANLLWWFAKWRSESSTFRLSRELPHDVTTIRMNSRPQSFTRASWHSVLEVSKRINKAKEANHLMFMVFLGVIKLEYTIFKCVQVLQATYQNHIWGFLYFLSDLCHAWFYKNLSGLEWRKSCSDLWGLQSWNVFQIKHVSCDIWYCLRSRKIVIAGHICRIFL